MIPAGGAGGMLQQQLSLPPLPPLPQLPLPAAAAAIAGGAVAASTVPPPGAQHQQQQEQQDKTELQLKIDRIPQLFDNLSGLGSPHKERGVESSGGAAVQHRAARAGEHRRSRSLPLASGHHLTAALLQHEHGGAHGGHPGQGGQGRGSSSGSSARGGDPSPGQHRGTQSIGGL